MNRLLVVICILLFSVIIVGFIAHNHSGILIDPLSQLEKTGKLTIRPAGPIEDATSPPTIPAVMGRVLFSIDGQVIGVLFSTPESDWCESRYSTPAGFIALKEDRGQED